MPALAHHSYAMFDHTKEVTLKDATVVGWEWTSPHTWLYLLVPNAGKEPTKYSVEGGNPGLLRRTGFSKGSMSPGDKVTVYISPLKNGDKGGAERGSVPQRPGARRARAAGAETVGRPNPSGSPRRGALGIA